MHLCSLRCAARRGGVDAGGSSDYGSIDGIVDGLVGIEFDGGGVAVVVVALKLCGVNATIIIFVFVLYCIVLYRCWC